MKNHMDRRKFLGTSAIGTSAILLKPSSVLADTPPKPATLKDFVYTDRHSSIRLSQPSAQEQFSFVIFGDRTAGRDSGLMVLAHAVTEVNNMGTDLVMTVGDMISGYNATDQWIEQMKAYKAVMNKLDSPWFPVAGNHDIYWRGPNRPKGSHDQDYEEHFGPLWYSFEHKNCCFVVLYSDEGDIENDKKGFGKPEWQKMSPQQLDFLKKTLQKASHCDHVFVFLHHPRWTGGNYGDDWNKVHEVLNNAGNVSACFAGHTHQMKYNGKRDGIGYYTLATTGGEYPDRLSEPLEGCIHHYDVVTIRGNEFHVTAIPVGQAIKPEAETMTRILLDEERWAISEENKRTLSYPIKVPHYNGLVTLKIGVSGGSDNTGDRGVEYNLYSVADDRIVKKGLIKSNSYEWIQYQAVGDSDFVFKLIDNDTSLTGKAPGNAGYIQMFAEAAAV